MPRPYQVILPLFLSLTLYLPADETTATHPSICPPETVSALEEALAARGMTFFDFTFEKDIATPTQALTIARTVLQDPMQLPVLADESLAALTSSEPAAFWRWAGELLDAESHPYTPGHVPAGTELSFPSRLDPVLSQTLAQFTISLLSVQTTVEDAFATIPTEDRAFASAYRLVGLYDAADTPEIRPKLLQCGISATLLDHLIDREEELDPRPAFEPFSAVLEKMDYASLMNAAQELEAAINTLDAQLDSVTHWPEEPLVITTPAGNLRIGTLGNDLHNDPSFTLIIDPGGNDQYLNTGGANGLLARPLSVILDRSGNDFYDDSALLGAGSALWGLAYLHDAGGDDIYRAAHAGQAAALFGIACLHDTAGNDLYTAGIFAQAAAIAGVARLEDLAGNDTFNLACAGQAYAGVAALAALVDRQGNDVYIAGRTLTDYDRHWKNHLSLAQGFATGIRPFTGGGVAILLDESGNDTYTADVYAQGVGYWYAMGFLLDLDGHDTYRLHEYGQGCGVHLAAGLLADLNGRDVYTAHSLAQGAAHDYAVGMLFEQAGNDTYTASHYAQGRGINNALGLLVDTRGEDAYFARQPEACQGAGHYADIREYDSLSILLDQADVDVYSSGASNGVATLRPDFGLIYDVSTNRPIASDVPVDSLDPPDLTNATLDKLMILAGRYGNTEERRVAREAAYQQLKTRGAPALEYLLHHANSDNMWYAIYAHRIVRESDAEATAPALLRVAANSTNAPVCKSAILLLGLHETPEYAPRIADHITNEITAGATMRTLGKWHITNEVDRIIPYLQNTNERKRIIAINALRDIGETNALQQVIPLLSDPFFTVRQAAERALTSPDH
ncbi:MAG: HEAT repeat domain-containing protein [Kiritimatiellae bacterium]|nr:HEAT repeat domain-containing protein [Kiritimatiellia bacterium]